MNAYLAESDLNPLAVLPTGAGKTIIFSTMIREWFEHYTPHPRVLILAHRRELLTQAGDKLMRVWREAPIGYWSAGLGLKQRNSRITIAGIQSIYRSVHKFAPWDIIIVDEAHLIPVRGGGMYRRFLIEAKKRNPHVRVIGFTATPFRLDGGYIANKDNDAYLLDEICYEADVANLIADGFLCPLRSKATSYRMDTAGVRKSGGDFVAGELERAVNHADLVERSVDELVARADDRRSWLVFCAGVDHAHAVCEEIRRHEVECEVVTGETPSDERDRIIRRFDSGELRSVVNVNVLTTGLDVQRIDLIALLRPTQSTSLYVQMVGRGFRLHEAKSDTLVLDFGGNVATHGPINSIRVSREHRGDGEAGDAPTKVCPECEEIVAAGFLTCPVCGYEWPPREVEHDEKPDEDTPIVITNEPQTVPVTTVEVHRHEKTGKPPSLCVTYCSGMLSYREWICLEHTGYPRRKAATWWLTRFGTPIPNTVDEALSDVWLARQIHDATEEIVIRRDGKHFEIVDYRLNVNRAARTA